MSSWTSDNPRAGLVTPGLHTQHIDFCAFTTYTTLDSLPKQTIFNGEKVRDVAKSSSETKVTRISAKDTGVKREKTSSVRKAVSEKAVKATDDSEKRRAGTRLVEYFKGSWHELTLVRWPDRKSAWKMTGALVTFTLVFGVLILLLDYLFQFVFKLLIGK